MSKFYSPLISKMQRLLTYFQSVLVDMSAILNQVVITISKTTSVILYLIIIEGMHGMRP